jgi:myo-inositol-1(or 4)-monophosphatase
MPLRVPQGGGCSPARSSLSPAHAAGFPEMTAIDFAAFVDELATVSGEAILPFFRTSLGIEDKGSATGFDPVTAADRAAETAMRTLIKRSFPEHGIVGEEYGDENTAAEYVWVLDPIDGTKSFITGMPAWGSLIALTRNGVPIFGMMHQPFIRERFTGDGGATQYRGPAGERGLHVRPCAMLGDAMMFTTSPRLMNESDRAAFGRVEAAAKLSRYGGDCYAYCMLAAGHVDLVIETGLKPHDIVALIPIVEGAGGVITSWEGGSAANGGRVIAAGDKRVHQAAIKLLTA